MRQVVLSMLIIIMLAGCAGVSRVPLDEKLTGRQLVMTTVSDPHAWAPTTQRSWMEMCDVKVIDWRESKEARFGDWDHQYSNCVQQSEVQFSTATGYIAGAMQPLIYSGAMVGSAFLIGDGLSKSGPTVNQTGGGASQSQTQGQVQGGFKPPFK